MNCTIKGIDTYLDDDSIIELTFTDEEGNAYDISAWTVYFGIKANIFSESVLIEKVITNHTEPELGKTEIDLERSDTDMTGTFVYDVRVEDENGKVTTVIVDKFKILQNASRIELS